MQSVSEKSAPTTGAAITPKTAPATEAAITPKTDPETGAVIIPKAGSEEMGAAITSKTAPEMKLYVVAATAVLPYSDDGPAGCGLQLECVKTEQEAVQTAIKFMKKYSARTMQLRIDGEISDIYVVKPAQLCDEGLKLTTFSQLDDWYTEFAGVIYDYVEAEKKEQMYYRNGSNVGSSLSLHIKDAVTDSYIMEYD